MTKTQIRKKFWKLVIPSLFAFILSGVYTIVDGIFIGNVMSDAGLASINFGYPICAIFISIGTGIGLSGAIRYTVALAQGEQKRAEKIFGTSLFLIVLTDIIISALLLIFTYPVLGFLGTSEELMEMTASYTRIIVYGGLLQILATGLVPFIRNYNGAGFAVFTMVCGFVTNIILDYLMIVRFGWGMAGAAWASVTGQALTAALSVIYLLCKRAKVRLPYPKQMFTFSREIFAGAASPFGVTYAPIVTLILMNKFLMIHGSVRSVAVYAVVDYVAYIATLLFQGVGDGCQPLVSEMYGSGLYEEQRYSGKLAYITGCVLGLLCMVALIALKDRWGIYFGSTHEASADIARYMVWFAIPCVFLAFARISVSYYSAIKKPLIASALTYLEPVSQLALFLILPLFAGETGVWLTIPLSQMILFAAALIINIMHNRSLKDPAR